MLQLDFVSPSGEQQTTFFDEGVKATGSITDWVYVGAVTLPQFSESGTWTLRYVYVHDEVGNLRDYEFAELRLLGFTGSFEVVATQDDVTPPELVELTLDRSEVDVSSRPATITVSARVSDDLSGATTLQMDFVSPSGEQQTTFFDEGVKATGSITDWVYVGAVTLPQFSESDTWTLRYVYVHDEVGNLRDYEFAELRLLGFTGSFEVVATQDDVTPPELVELTLDRSEVDVSSGPATITVSARVSDDLSGADMLQLDFVSPSGEQQTTFFDEGVKATGSITDWVYVGAVTLPQFSESGTWTLRYVYVHDEVGNLRDYGFAELSLLGFTGSFEVLDNRSK